MKVQIPDEPPVSVESGDEKDDEESQDRTLLNTGAGRGVKNPVVLPPPSPDTNANANNLASAGAQGPANPYAKLPPLTPGATTGTATLSPSASGNNGQSGGGNNAETPLAVLPSRFISDTLLSPSSLYPELNVGRFIASSGTNGNTPTSAIAPATSAVATSGTAAPSATTSGVAASGATAPGTGASTDRLVAMGIGIGVGLGMGMNNNGGGDLLPSPIAWGASTGQQEGLHDEAAGNTQGRVAEENDEKENIGVASVKEDGEARDHVAAGRGGEVNPSLNAGGKTQEEKTKQGEDGRPPKEFGCKRPRENEIDHHDAPSLAKRTKLE